MGRWGQLSESRVGMRRADGADSRLLQRAWSTMCWVRRAPDYRTTEVSRSSRTNLHPLQSGSRRTPPPSPARWNYAPAARAGFIGCGEPPERARQSEIRHGPPYFLPHIGFRSSSTGEGPHDYQTGLSPVGGCRRRTRSSAGVVAAIASLAQRLRPPGHPRLSSMKSQERHDRRITRFPGANRRPTSRLVHGHAGLSLNLCRRARSGPGIVRSQTSCTSSRSTTTAMPRRTRSSQVTFTTGEGR